jgi:hypothetical protein
VFCVYLLFFQHSFQSAFNLLLIYEKDVRHILLLKIELQQPYEMDYKLYCRVQQNPHTKPTQCLEIMKASCDCATEPLSQEELSPHHTGTRSISNMKEIICVYTKKS